MTDLLADIWPELTWDVREAPSGTRAVARIADLHLDVTVALRASGTHTVYATTLHIDGLVLWVEAVGSLEDSLRAAKARIANRRARLGQCPQT